MVSSSLRPFYSRNEMNKYVIAAMGIGIPFCLMASEMEFSYNAEGIEPYGFGYKKTQTYDVGIALNTAQVTGKKIVGFSVPVFDASYVSGTKVWLSKNLTVSKDNESKFTPDLVSYDVVVTDGIINFTLPESYTIPEEGVYIGYSLTTSDVPEEKSALPIAVIDGSKAGGLWFHATTSQKKWADFAVRNSMTSDIKVTLSGDFMKDAASVEFKSERIYAAINEKIQLPINIINWGDHGISSFDYTYTIDGNSHEGRYEFDEATSTMLGGTKAVDLELTAIDKLGDFELNLSIDKVNGLKNESSDISASVPVTVQPFVATYRPLVEEYTGLNCGWCPRGYVMMEQMKMYHGDMFVGMAYHTYGGDPMDCTPNPPYRPSGFPAATLNRGSQLDPGDIPSYWAKVVGNHSPAEVTVDISWKDAEKTTLVATAKARFVSDIVENDYKFSIAFIADGLSNPKWGQNNGYSNYEAEGQYTEPFWDLFIGKSSNVKGLEFNDVVVHYPEFAGTDGSLPESIEANVWYEYETEISVGELANISGEKIIENYDKIRAIALVVKGSGGKPINCASSKYPDGNSPFAGIVTVEEDLSVIDTIYYDLQGQRAINPSTGLHIKIERLSDGTFRSSKVIF